MWVTVFAVQGDGIHTHKNARFCRQRTNRVVILPAAVKAVVAQRRASVGILHRYYRRREKRLFPRKIFPTGKASIAAGMNGKLLQAIFLHIRGVRIVRDVERYQGLMICLPPTQN